MLLTSESVPAQKQRPSGKTGGDVETLVAIKVSGTTRYTDKEILTATGLQIGQPAAEGDFKEAVQRLGASGMFTDLVYSYTSSGDGEHLRLELTDVSPDKLVSARFDNFVWFTDQELQDALQSRVPLFKQRIPLGGTLADRVSEALQSLLTEKTLPGRVEFVGQGQDQLGGPLVAITYRVADVNIEIRSLEFPGSSPEYGELLTTAARRLIGARYSRAALAAVAQYDLLPVYRQRGFLKASFGPASARVGASPTSAGSTNSADLSVDAVVPVVPGSMYQSSGVHWQGNSAIGETEIARLLHLAVGRPVDAVRLERDLENVIRLYHSRGYVTAQVQPEAQFDDDKHSVAYQVKVIEGELYTMGELEITGLDTQATAQMRGAWKLRQGQPYNADYLKKFLNDARQFIPRGGQWAISTHETPDAKDRTVDVEVHFKQQ
jgi:outer membrane protein assembly factor BamA